MTRKTKNILTSIAGALLLVATMASFISSFFIPHVEVPVLAFIAGCVMGVVLIFAYNDLAKKGIELIQKLWGSKN